jgi:hypothetical protein
VIQIKRAGVHERAALSKSARIFDELEQDAVRQVRDECVHKLQTAWPGFRDIDREFLEVTLFNYLAKHLEDRKKIAEITAEARDSAFVHKVLREFIFELHERRGAAALDRYPMLQAFQKEDLLRLHEKHKPGRIPYQHLSRDISIAITVWFTGHVLRRSAEVLSIYRITWDYTRRTSDPPSRRKLIAARISVLAMGEARIFVTEANVNRVWGSWKAQLAFDLYDQLLREFPETLPAVSVVPGRKELRPKK